MRRNTINIDIENTYIENPTIKKECFTIVEWKEYDDEDCTVKKKQETLISKINNIITLIYLAIISIIYK